MIVFKKLSIQNFLSYGNNETHIDLNCSAPTLITGINYDASVNGELDSNGCGKSTILNALSYVLYNKAISISENLDQLINNVNQKDMLVVLVFTKDKTTYRISRFRKNKAMGGNGVLIEQKKGKSWKDITSTKPELQISESILQIPFTVFNRIIGYAAGEEPFLKMGLPKQREVIDELFEYTELTKRADRIKELMKGLKKDLEYAIESNQDIKEEAKRHKEQYESMVSESKVWETAKEESIEKMEVLLHDLSSVDFKGQKELLKSISEMESELSSVSTNKRELERDLKKAEDEQMKYENFDADNAKKVTSAEIALNDSKIKRFSEEEQLGLLEKKKDITTQLNVLSSDLSALTRKEKKLDSALIELKNELSHLEDAKCPYCLQKFEDAKEKIAEIKTGIKTTSSDLSDVSEAITKTKTQVETLNENLDQIDSRLVFDSTSDVTNYLNGIQRLEEKIETLRSSTNPYNDNSATIVEAKDSITGLESKLSKLSIKIKKLKTDLTFESESELVSSLTKLESMKERLEEKRQEQNPYTSILNNLEGYQPKEHKDDEIEKLETRILHCDFLIKLLTKKDSYLRKALMDKYLPMLNKRLHHYLNLMALPHKVVFSSDLTTEISQFGQSIPYGNLSAGQRARINIALSLSFRDVLQSKHNFINLFILDECLDVGLSNVGVRKTVKAIKEVAKTNKLSMFVISHRDEAKESFPDKLEIELRNGFSAIKKGA